MEGYYAKAVFGPVVELTFAHPPDPEPPRFRLISVGECCYNINNERRAGRGDGLHSPWGRGDVLREFHELYIHIYMGGGRGARISVPPIGSDLDAPTAVVWYNMHGAGGIQGLDLRSAGDAGGGGRR